MPAATTSDNIVLSAHEEKIHGDLRNTADVEYVTAGGDATPRIFTDVFSVPTTSLDDVGDIRKLYQFPAGSYLVDFRGTPSDGDTNATPTLVYSVLVIDSADATKVTVVLSSTNGQAAAGSDDILTAAKFKFVGGYYLALKIGTVAATPAAMTYKVGLSYAIGTNHYAANVPLMTDSGV